jgi:peptidoglycan/xylan/chitin deacetylase (PgdA/CDA1 family)
MGAPDFMTIMRRNPSRAEITGILVGIAAAAILWIHPFLTAALLFLYVMLCVGACFFPQTNFLGPVESRGKTGQTLVALTFDDGPAEPTTRQVLDLLEKHGVLATFFVSGANAKSHPDLIADILARGHSIGNHSLNHMPYLMLRGSRTLHREVAEAQLILRSMGVDALAFRPPVGIINPKLPGVLNSLNMFCVTFSCRAFDAGNRRIHNLAARILRKVKADDIILLHDVPAPNAGDSEQLLAEMEKIIAGIQKKGLRIVPLPELIGREVMTILRR